LVEGGDRIKLPSRNASQGDATNEGLRADCARRDLQGGAGYCSVAGISVWERFFSVEVGASTSPGSQ